MKRNLFKTGIVALMILGATLLTLDFWDLSFGDTAPATPSGKPAILFCTWSTRGYVDFNYYQEMEKAGFRVDYLDSWADFSLDKIKGYNAIVLFSFPTKTRQQFGPEGSPGKGWTYEQTLDAVKQYLALGGGVIIDVDALRPRAPAEQITDDHMASIQSALNEFGAKVPYELFNPPAAEIFPNPHLGNRPYFYASETLPSPVSDGVHGLWLPLILDGHGYLSAGPVVVDSNWTPVVRAGKTVNTKPIPMGSAETNYAPGTVVAGLFERDGGEMDSVVFAIRSVGPGRMALFNLKPDFHIGSGTKWFYDRITLDKGLNGKPSDFGKLLMNTLRWASAPSLGGAALGSADIPADRLIPPNLRPDIQAKLEVGHPTLKLPAPDAPVVEKNKLFRGFVGARTALTTGTGSIQDYAQAAKAAHLDFVIFMEEGNKLDAEKLTTLEDDCKRYSDASLLLVPGFSYETNVGPHMLVYGPKLVLPTEPELVSKSKPGTFALQQEDEKGNYIASALYLNYVFHIMDLTRPRENNVVYFDFGASQQDGRIRLSQARGYGGGGIFYYRGGKLIEDNRADYLQTNGSTMTSVPFSIAEVSSPAEMTDHVQSGRALTYAQAHSVQSILVDALHWNHQFEAPPAFVSEGPTIANWAVNKRANAYGAEDFVNERGTDDQELLAKSDAGIKEVRIYDGSDLYRRFLPGGAKDFSIRLYISAFLQQNLGLEVEDINGKVATSFPYRSMKNDKLYVSFCGDHVNDCGGSVSVVKMAHGPFSLGTYSPAYTPDPGTTWDGGPPSVVQLLPYDESIVSLQTDAGEQSGQPIQYPILDFVDERVYRGASKAVGALPFGANAWRGWGPVGPLPIADIESSLTLFRQPTTGVDASAGPDQGMEAGSASSLYEATYVFKGNGNLQNFTQSIRPTAKIPPVHGTLLVGMGDQILGTASLDFDDPHRKTDTLDVPAGGWFAAFAPSGGNALLAFNRGEALRFVLHPSQVELHAALPATGRPVKKDDKFHVEIFTTMWAMGDTFTGNDQLLDTIRYLRNPAGLEILRGKRITGDGGLQELTATDGAVEIRAAGQTPATKTLPVSLSVRAAGFNRNWTAGEFQIEGYVGANYYSTGAKVFRPIGVDRDGRIYAPLYVSHGNVHTILGHPIIADQAGHDLKIQVTALQSPRDGTPGSWHVSVNNPTDQPITTTLKKAIDLPGLKFTSQQITVAPGAYRILEHGDIDPAQLEKSSYPKASGVETK
jgi:hypothetical protein